MSARALLDIRFAPNLLSPNTAHTAQHDTNTRNTSPASVELVQRGRGMTDRDGAEGARGHPAPGGLHPQPAVVVHAHDLGCAADSDGGGRGAEEVRPGGEGGGASGGGQGTVGERGSG